jgi:hypothetical protein
LIKLQHQSKTFEMVFRIVIRYWLMVTMLVQTGMVTGQFAYVDTTYDMHRFHFETSYSSLKLSDDKFIITLKSQTDQKRTLKLLIITYLRVSFSPPKG